MALQHLRSSAADKRPTPAVMSDGQLAMNTHLASPGLFLKDSNGDLVKVGPVHVGTTAPNATPGAGGQAGNSKGEQWLDTSSSRYVFKIWDGTAWRTEDGEFVNVSGDLMTGALGIIAGAAATPGLYFSGDTNTGIYSSGADQVAISTNGTERLRINSSGRVGIGTTSPSQALEVLGNIHSVSGGSNEVLLAGVEGAIELSRSDSGSYIDFKTTNLEDFDCRIQQSSNGLVFSTGGNGATSERLRIDSSGNVGIGTSSPAQALHVSQSGGNNFAGIRTQNSNSGTGIAGLEFSSDATYAKAAVGLVRSAVNGVGSLVFYNASSTGAANWSTADERLRIDSSGNVGIGTTSPGATLDVSGNIRLSAALPNIEFNNGGAMVYGPAGNTLAFATGGGPGSPSEKARIDSSGRLLVGTSTATDNTRFNQSLAVVNAGASQYGGASLTSYPGTNASFAPVFDLNRSRGTANGSMTAVVSGDELGFLVFRGADGSAFQDAASIKAQVDGTPGAADMPGRLVFSTTADGAASPTERMRIGNDGTTIAFSSGDATLVVRNSNGASTTTSCIICTHSSTGMGDGPISFIVRTNGNALNTNNSYGGISDIRLKENIVDANSQWDDIKALQVRNYNFKEGQTHTQIGLVAQEVELVSPGLVNESPDRDDEGNDLGTVTKSVNYSVLYMKAVKALQEAMERIETLEARLTAAGIE